MYDEDTEPVRLRTRVISWTLAVALGATLWWMGYSAWVAVR